MNNIDTIVKAIQRNMQIIDATKPTVSVIYDSILETYPKLYTNDKKVYHCYRKVIIEEITNFYDSTTSNEKNYIQIILTRFIQECLDK